MRRPAPLDETKQSSALLHVPSSSAAGYHIGEGLFRFTARRGLLRCSLLRTFPRWQLIRKTSLVCVMTGVSRLCANHTTNVLQYMSPYKFMHNDNRPGAALPQSKPPEQKTHLKPEVETMSLQYA